MELSFKDFTDTQKFVLTYSGLTLEETLDRDLRSTKAGKGPDMGPDYIKTLRSRFALQSSASAQLPVTDPNQEIRPALRDAYKAFKGRPVDRKPLLQFFKAFKYLNTRESVGVARAILEQNPHKCHDQRAFVLSAMTWFKENDLANKVCPYNKNLVVFGAQFVQLC